MFLKEFWLLAIWPSEKQVHSECSLSRLSLCCSFEPDGDQRGPGLRRGSLYRAGERGAKVARVSMDSDMMP